MNVWTGLISFVSGITKQHVGLGYMPKM